MSSVMENPSWMPRISGAHVARARAALDGKIDYCGMAALDLDRQADMATNGPEARRYRDQAIAMRDQIRRERAWFAKVAEEARSAELALAPLIERNPGKIEPHIVRQYEGLREENQKIRKWALDDAADIA